MKIRSFTLIELVVALTITSIVMGIVYTSYEIVGKNYRNMKAENELIYEYHLLHSLLGKDLDRCNIVVKESDFDLLLDPGEQQQVSYAFYEDYIIRTIPQQSDTFKIGVLDVYMKELDEKIVQELMLEINCLGKVTELHYNKIYAADVLMQLDDEY